MVLTTPPISFNTSVAPMIIGGTEEAKTARNKCHWHSKVDFVIAED